MIDRETHPPDQPPTTPDVPKPTETPPAGAGSRAEAFADSRRAALEQLELARAAEEAEAGAGSGPWAAEGRNPIEGNAVAQTHPGSCVSATGEMLTNGEVTQADLLDELGEWSNPEHLRDALNARTDGAPWIGGGFADEDVTVAMANRGPMGALVWMPGSRVGHMVVTEPLGEGKYLVRDPDPGCSYEVDEHWIRTYVAQGVFR